VRSNEVSDQDLLKRSEKTRLRGIESSTYRAGKGGKKHEFERLPVQGGAKHETLSCALTHRRTGGSSQRRGVNPNQMVGETAIDSTMVLGDMKDNYGEK